MNAIIGEKLGMTQIFDEDNRAVPVTAVKAGPVVVTQIKRPDTDGYGAIHELRSHSELDGTVIIVLSASVFPYDRQHSVEAGGDDFIPKPIRVEELLDKLGKHIGITWRRRAQPAAGARPAG